MALFRIKRRRSNKDLISNRSNFAAGLVRVAVFGYIFNQYCFHFVFSNKTKFYRISVLCKQHNIPFLANVTNVRKVELYN
jgi:hypothetical protein